MIDGTCDGCTYALPGVGDDDSLLLKCRRYPPVIFVLDEHPTQAFPDATNRCGEYKEDRLSFLETLKEKMKENDG